MDLLDLLALVQPPMPGGRAPRSPAENLTYALATLVFPLLLFVLVLFAGLWAHPGATLALSLAFIAATVLVARLLAVGTAQTLSAAIACALACFIFGCIALLLGALGSFYSTF